MKKSFTTTEIAAFFGVDKTTVAKWIDKGKVAAFKTPGGHRRVFPENVSKLMTDMGMEVPEDVTRFLEPRVHA